MCSSVFRKGDVVYHPKEGECIVKQVDVNVTMLDGKGWYENEILSFSPWPKPCHERPFTEVGWWVVAFSDGSMGVRWRSHSTGYRLYKDKPGGETLTNVEHWHGRYIKFLGTEL